MTSITDIRHLTLKYSPLILAAFLMVENTLAAPQQAPYLPSTVINQVTWDSANRIQAATGSDLWPTTWGQDGNIYTAWGDGGGFGGSNSLGRVSMGIARLEGMPPTFTGINVNGGINPLYASSFPSKGKTAGILSVNGVLYSWVNMQNGNPPDKKLAWSSDLGKTWQLSTWKFPDQIDPQFSPETFVNFGQDYAGAMDNYIYSYGGKWIPAQGASNDAYLIRVDKQKIMTRSAYQFFSGFDSNKNPVWSNSIQDRKPVYSDPNGIGNSGMVSVIYNAPLKRYFLTVAHRAPAGTGNSYPDFGTLSNLGIFDSAKPWGPWTTVAYYDNWLGFGDNDEALAFSFPGKWISADGKTMWLIFSGYPSADNFNLIKATLTLSPTTTPSIPSGLIIKKK